MRSCVIFLCFSDTAICRASRYKRRPTGGRRPVHKKKRKFECGRPAAMTKLGNKRIHLVRARGGNYKHRALRLDTGNFSWGSEGKLDSAYVDFMSILKYFLRLL